MECVTKTNCSWKSLFMHFVMYLCCFAKALEAVFSGFRCSGNRLENECRLVPGRNIVECGARNQLNSRWLIAESMADDC